MIQLEYDDQVVTDERATMLAENARRIVMEVTGIKDVFVYANSARIKIAVAPAEIFIHINAKKVDDANALVAEITDQLVAWKRISDFAHPLNITVIPAKWHFKLGA